MDILKNAYESFVGTVQIQAKNLPREVSVTFKSKCSDPFGELIQTPICKNVPNGANVDFIASISINGCLDEPIDFEISQAGINQNLKVRIESNCQCPCEEPNHPTFQLNSGKCNNAGNFTCGICQCSPGFTGQFCECNENNFLTGEDPESQCKDETSANPDVICSGRGSCFCGRCSCDADNPKGLIYGPFCECDNFSCLRSNGALCSGNGECECGECQCFPSWTGEDCSCPTARDQCLSPYNGKDCSGHGLCQCNRCKCDTDVNGGLFTGQFCEMFPNEIYPCKLLGKNFNFNYLESSGKSYSF